MRIAEVAEFYSPTGGGVRSYIDGKFEAARRAGHELYVLAPAAEDGFEPRAGGGIVKIRSPLLPFDANYRMFWRAAPVHRALDQLQPDLVEASSPRRGAWIAAGWPGRAPRTMFFHADPVASYPHRWLSSYVSPDRIDRLFEWFWAYLRRLTTDFQSIVVGGAWLGHRLQAHALERVAAVPLGVDTGAFSPHLRDEGLRARLLADCGLPASGHLLLGVGRFHGEKRWPTVIAAAAAAGADLPLGLVLVGDGMDRARVERAAAGNPRVRLHGDVRERAELARIFASGDALVHGCDSETFGLATAEAKASGLPLVVPDRGGAAYLAEPDSSETYRAGDAEAGAAAIRRLLARDPAALRARARHAADSVRSDSEHYAALFDHFADIVRQGPAVRRSPTSPELAPQPVAMNGAELTAS